MTRFSLSLISLSSHEYFSEGLVESTGGSERQMRYLADVLLEEGYRLRFVTANLNENGTTLEKNLFLVSLWSKGDSYLRKMMNMFRLVISSREPIYMRGVSTAHMMIVLAAKFSGRTAMINMTSDLHCTKGGSVRSYVLRWLLFKLSGEIIAQSSEQQQLIKKNFGVSSKILPNFINPGRFIASKGGDRFEDRSIDVVWVGTVEPRKGLERVIAIAVSLPELQFVVIGKPDDLHMDYGERLLDEMDKLPNVKVMGYVQPNLIGDILATSKILINTSKKIESGVTKEGFPNVFLEAWEFGSLVLSMGIDPDALISSAGLGTLCDTQEQAVELISQYIGDPKIWEVKSKKALEFVSTRDVTCSMVRKEIIRILDVAG